MALKKVQKLAGLPPPPWDQSPQSEGVGLYHTCGPGRRGLHPEDSVEPKKDYSLALKSNAVCLVSF